MSGVAGARPVPGAVPVEPPATSTGSWRFRPDVEGLRAVAIVAVVGYHVGLPGFGGGFVGVDVFFVISGFLITGLLVAEVDRHGHISLARFWARRARRLLPAATLVLAVVALLSWFALPRLDHRSVGLDVIASALYVSNLRFAAQATDYLASDAAPSPVLHFWSLGVEEQFYVVWPLLVLAVALLARRRIAADGVRRQHLGLVLAVLGAASFVLSLWLTARAQPGAFFGMPTRAWEFALGGLLAIGATRVLALPAAVRRAAGWVGGAVLLGSIVLVDGDRPYPGTQALWPVLGTAAVILAGSSAADRAGAGSVSGPLTAWPMRALGRLSYSWYLWHWPALVLATAVWGELGTPVLLVVALLMLVPSALSYRFVEQPLRHRPSLVASSRRSLLLGLALSLSAALCGALLAVVPGGGGWASAAPAAAPEADGGRGAAPAAPDPTTSAAPAPSGSPQAITWPSGPLTPDPTEARADLPVIYSDGCHLSIAATDPPECAYADTRSSTTVVLLGDSHAAQWFPALRRVAEKKGWRLVVRTKSGCPAPDVTILQRRLSRPYDECDTWRAAVLDELVRTRPALVVAAGTRTDSLVDRASGDPAASSAAGDEWKAGWRRTLTPLEKAGIPVAVLRDTPWPGKDMAGCVDRNRERPSACDVSRKALDSPAYDVRTTTGSPTARGVDLSDVICDADRCPATRGKYLVYRDTDHLTAAFARALAPYLGERLEPLLR